MTEPAGSAVFVIVENDPIVAQDLVEAIRLQRPGSPIALWPRDGLSRDTVAARLEQIDRIEVAFLSMPLADMRACGIDAAVLVRGGRVVVMADDPGPGEADAATCLVVSRPFASDDLVPFILANPAGGADGAR